MPEQRAPVWLDLIKIEGYRGFSAPALIQFAKPDGTTRGSGLTVVVGANGAGKSTVLEVLRFLQKIDVPRVLTDNQRNAASRGVVSITYRSSSGKTLTLATQGTGGGGLQWQGVDEWDIRPNDVFTVPVRRRIESQWGTATAPTNSRNNYSAATALLDFRAGGDPFYLRLAAADAKNGDFNPLLERILKPMLLPSWHVSDEGGRAYLRIYGTSAFNAAGLGDGIASVFQIVDALYDSPGGDIVGLDELDTSLHPTVQHNLLRELAGYASQRQIIFTTHSPLLVDWQLIAEGAGVVRLVSDPAAVRAETIEKETREAIRVFLNDINNPHVLGPRANEILFLDDQIILVEGQQDVLLYPKVLGELGTSFLGTMFGWGSGGVDKMTTVALLLQDLGFRRVAAIVDKNVADKLPAMREKFPAFYFTAIPAHDVRTKPADEKCGKREVIGLLDENFVLRPEFKDSMRRLVEEMNHYFRTGQPRIPGALAFGEVKNP